MLMKKHYRLKDISISGRMKTKNSTHFPLSFLSSKIVDYATIKVILVLIHPKGTSSIHFKLPFFQSKSTTSESDCRLFKFIHSSYKY